MKDTTLTYLRLLIGKRHEYATAQGPAAYSRQSWGWKNYMGIKGLIDVRLLDPLLR
jgi:hypothetical protein